jgi:hypothetical protein
VTFRGSRGSIVSEDRDAPLGEYAHALAIEVDGSVGVPVVHLAYYLKRR